MRCTVLLFSNALHCTTLCFIIGLLRGPAWIIGLKPTAGKHAPDVSALDAYATKRWEVGGDGCRKLTVLSVPYVWSSESCEMLVRRCVTVSWLSSRYRLFLPVVVCAAFHGRVVGGFGRRQSGHHRRSPPGQCDDEVCVIQS